MIEGVMSEAATAMQGLLHGADAAFAGISTDSRSVHAGQLFFALRGPNFDGARYTGEVAAKQASGAVVQDVVADELPCITVDDTRLALGRLARHWRGRMPATVIGLTGSNGKTTLKEMLAACFSQVDATLATAGNLNNDIGLPLMLLRLAPEHRYAVIEMGANHAGEIAYLTSLAGPAIVAITNAGPAHLEGFGSIDGVARAKGEILQGDVRPQAAVLNADDDYFPLWQSMASDLDIVSFGRASNATVRLGTVDAGGHGSTFRLHLPDCMLDIALALYGTHNAMNAAAAAAVAVAAGLQPLQIKRGLEAVRPVDGRLQALPGVGGMRIYNDTYNANPTSVIAAAEFVAGRPGESWLVFGDMGELGDRAADLHRAVGEGVKRAGIDRLLATGPLSQQAVVAFGDGASWYATVDDLVAALKADAPRDVNVLIKGSRAMRMERVVAALGSAPAAGGEH